MRNPNLSCETCDWCDLATRTCHINPPQAVTVSVKSTDRTNNWADGAGSVSAASHVHEVVGVWPPIPPPPLGWCALWQNAPEPATSE